MYTTDSQKRAERALQTFEQVRSYFIERSTNKKAPEGQVRIIAFSSEKEYKPYRLNEGAFAYYLDSRQRDYIVMQDIEPEHAQSAIHEYTHLIVEHAHLNLPLWLNEGIADLYSSLEPRGKQAMVGRPLPGRIASLLQGKWMDWDALLAVDHSSPYYNERDKMSIFYGQSWLLTHMLALSPAYNPKFAQFVTAVGGGGIEAAGSKGGMTSAEAFQKVYGKTVTAVGKDAERYMHQNSVKVALFDFTMGKTDLDPQVSEPSSFDTGLVLAELLASRSGTMQEAQDRLLALEKENPESAEVEESLGYLAWRRNDLPETRRHFDLAVQHGSKNVKLMVADAGLAQQSGVDPQKAVDLLEQAVKLQPDDAETRIFLAEVEAGRERYGRVLGITAPIHSVPPRLAYRLFAVNAYTHANLRDPQGARTLAKKALEYAKTSSERVQITRLLQSLDASGRPAAAPTAPEGQIAQAEDGDSSSRPNQPGHAPILARSQGLPRAQGKTKALECGSGSYRLHLQAGSREMVFSMNKPDNIMVRNHDPLEWNCGPLQPLDITVIYQPETGSKVDGKVSELIF